MSYACQTPEGYHKHQLVTVCFSYHGYDTNYSTEMLYQSDNNSQKYCLCWGGRIFDVIPANKQGLKQGYKYMIWGTSLPIYFNIDE